MAEATWIYFFPPYGCCFCISPPLDSIAGGYELPGAAVEVETIVVRIRVVPIQLEKEQYGFNPSQSKRNSVPIVEI